MSIRNRRPVRWLAILVLSGWSGLGPMSKAGPPHPRLSLVFPPGGQAGTSVDVVVSGSGLEGLSALRCVEPRIAAIPRGDRRFTIHIPKEIPPGLYDLRAVGRNGMSSPRSFFVSPRETLRETEPNGTHEGSQRIHLDAALCGIIAAPGDVDAFRFQGQAGQRVVIECWAERLDSRLRAVLELEDPQGRRVAANRGYTGLDPLIDYRVPADGDFVVRVFDLTFTGSPEHVYRLDIDTGPRVEFAMPTVLEQGKTSRVTLFGRNLVKECNQGRTPSLDHVEVDVTPPPPGLSGHLRTFLCPSRFAVDVFPVDYPGAPAPVLLGVTDVPVIPDNGANHQPKAAQAITWPCEVSGQLAEGAEKDWYVIRAQRGDVLWLEAYGERIGSPVDLDLSVFDARGERELVHWTDCQEDRGVGEISTNHCDPSGRWVVPAEGSYRILIRNVIGGLSRDPRRVYRLSVRREEAGFQLLAIPGCGREPAGGNVGRGGRALLELVAARSRGLSQPIRVTATGLPAGWECPDVWFGPGVDRVPLIVSASRDCERVARELNLVGHADLGGVEIVRQARGATVISSGPPTASARLTGEIPIATGPDAPWIATAAPNRTEVSQGSILDVAIGVAVVQGERIGPVTLTGIGVPAEGSDRITTLPVNQSKGWVSIQVPDNLPPGPYTFAIQADSVLTLPGTSSGEKPRKLASTIYSNPMTIQVGPGAFDLRVDPRNPRQIKRGQVIQLHYRALRRNGFIGKIHTELGAPEGVIGLRARGVTFVGQTDAGSLQVIASDDAPLGRQPFLRLDAVGTVEDVPIHHVACFLDLEITD